MPALPGGPRIDSESPAVGFQGHDVPCGHVAKVHTGAVPLHHVRPHGVDVAAAVGVSAGTGVNVGLDVSVGIGADVAAVVGVSADAVPGRLVAGSVLVDVGWSVSSAGTVGGIEVGVSVASNSATAGGELTPVRVVIGPPPPSSAPPPESRPRPGNTRKATTRTAPRKTNTPAATKSPTRRFMAPLLRCLHFAPFQPP